MMTTETKTSSTNREVPATSKIRLGWVGVFLILFIVSVPLFYIRQYSKTLISQPRASPTAKADCGVVLTGGGGRIREGMALLSHRQVKKLIISGVHQRSTLSDMFPEILFYPEINLDDVVLERRSSSTAGNAQQSQILIDALHCQSILLITSDYHMHRAHQVFQLAIPSTVAITDYPVSSDRLHYRQGLVVDLRFWSTVIEEWTKYLFYALFVF